MPKILPISSALKVNSFICVSAGTKGSNFLEAIGVVLVIIDRRSWSPLLFACFCPQNSIEWPDPAEDQQPADHCGNEPDQEVDALVRKFTPGTGHQDRKSTR